MLYFNHFGSTIQDLKDFRQLGSRTPGHPKYGVNPGVDATTGLLSQGIRMAFVLEDHLVMADRKRLAKVGLSGTGRADAMKEQPQGYHDSVLPTEVTKRVSIEIGLSQSWYEFVDLDG